MTDAGSSNSPGETETNMIPRDEWEWFGWSGHLIVGQDCRFHLCTRVGDYLISTVGAYLPDEGSREIHAKVRGITLTGRGDDRRADFMRKCGWVEIGYARTFETMVFRLGRTVCAESDCNCGMPSPDDWGELAMEGYHDAAAATAGHLRMCERFASPDERSEPR